MGIAVCLIMAHGADEECLDDPEYAANCSFWAEAGECNGNARFMLTHCHKACGCRERCSDTHPDPMQCDQWAKSGECERNRFFMHTSCRLACGCPAACEDSAEWASHCPMWAQQGQCDDNAQFMSVHCRYSCRCPKPCLDRESFENCSAWRQAGECENNKPYMSRRCAATCGTCAMLDYTRTCPLPDRADAAVQPGMMKAMFERAVSNFPELEPSLLSADPPIVLFDAFLDEAEISSLLSYGEGRYERAMASGGRKEDEFIAVASEIRTAMNTWCNDTCMADPVVLRVAQRMSEVTQVPFDNSEFIQFLRYLPCPDANATHPDCQFYRRHHDYIPEMVGMQPGPRVYTFFLYLSDVEEGGGTQFDGGFTVQPRAGRAVLWPSTLNESPFEQDERTHHEALPVLKGVKYAANFWLHQFDFKSAHKNGCTA